MIALCQTVITIFAQGMHTYHNRGFAVFDFTKLAFAFFSY
jgi:hypothetical protein